MKLGESNTRSAGLLARRARGTADADMDITPMIDITFLLLIFFIVASKMDSGSEVPLPLAKHGTGVTSKNSVVITVTRGDPQANIFMGNGTDAALALKSVTPADQDVEIAEFVRQSFAADTRKHQVLVRAGKDVAHRDVSRVLHALGQLDGPAAYVAVLEEK